MSLVDSSFVSPAESDDSTVDIVPIVVTQHVRLWFRDLEDVMAADDKITEEDIGEALALYNRAQKVVNLGNAFAT